MAQIAGRQHGVVTRRQLLAAGFTAKMIDLKLRSGALHHIHVGVYIVGHLAIDPLAYETAAVLAYAPRALLSHYTAAHLWKLRVERLKTIHVTVVGRRPSPRAGTRLHHISELHPTELRRHMGLPLTSPALTILDLAGSLPAKGFRAVLNEARVQRLVTDAKLRATIERHPRRKGAAALRARLDAETSPLTTNSEAEARCLELIIAADLEPDETQARIGPYQVDFLYRKEHLIVEVDGYRFHSTPDRFVDDRRRIADLMTRGYEVFPLSWSDLVDQPEESMRRLRETLARRRIRSG